MAITEFINDLESEKTRGRDMAAFKVIEAGT
jgi:hypothetical protein